MKPGGGLEWGSGARVKASSTQQGLHRLFPRLTHTFGPNLSVTIRAGALVGARQVMTLLAGAAVMQGLRTLIHVCRRHHLVPAWGPVYHTS